MPQSSNNLGLFQQLCNQERSLVEWSRCNSDDVRLSVVNNLVGSEHLGAGASNSGCRRNPKKEIKKDQNVCF